MMVKLILIIEKNMFNTYLFDVDYKNLRKYFARDML